jgi:pimeloyl-ACP methyl ester carboxylesterase
MEKEIWLIHGANSTPLSFNYIIDELIEDDRFTNWSVIRISYDCQDSILGLIDQLSSKLPTDREVFLLGHSLGGLIAVGATQKYKRIHGHVNNIRAVITLGSPFGGSESATYLQWLFPGYNLFKSISPTGKLVTSIQATGAVVPTLSFVTTAGNNPLFHEANDGIVTVRSQRSLGRAKFIEVPYNHFEVLLSTDIIDHIKNILFYPYSNLDSYVRLLPETPETDTQEYGAGAAGGTGTDRAGSTNSMQDE